jgi:hypothetical protein
MPNEQSGLIVGAALAAKFKYIAAKAAPTSCKSIVDFIEN